MRTPAFRVAVAGDRRSDSRRRFAPILLRGGFGVTGEASCISGSVNNVAADEFRRSAPVGFIRSTVKDRANPP